MNARIVIVQPMGFRDRSLMQRVLELASQEAPPWVRIHAAPWSVEPPIEAFDWKRRQYRADLINLFLHEFYKTREPSNVLVVGVVRGDGFIGELNFVFGLASPQISVATVYTARLETASLDKTASRIAKEILHEMGHLLGLNHCSNPSCVMSFSNTVDEVDKKGPGFCDTCLRKLSFKHKSA